ncbi:MAG: siroheme synthase CysG [Alphaproteobacteria bacterium]
MGYTPLFLNAKKHGTILVIGGGEIAAAKTEALASVGAHVEIIASEISTGLKILCEKHNFPSHQVNYDPSFLDGKKIVIAATDHDKVNEQIAKDCNARGILVNVVDNPPLCDFIFPALIRRGALQIAVSSSGVSPVLARMVKHTIERVIPVGFTNLIDFMHDKKATLRERLSKIQPRRLIGEDIFHGPIAEELYEGNTDKANLLFKTLLNETENKKQGALYLIGAGPGNPDLITIKATRLLSKADIILYDRLVSPVIIEQYGRKDAEKISVGKRKDHHHKTQAQIDALIEQHLIKGNVVVRLKGGDPGVYAHGAEEIAIAKRVGAPYQIVPGISAANGCAAYAGIPLTERGGAVSVRFITLYTKTLQNDDFWLSVKHAQNETFVFYMSTPHYALLCQKLIELGFPPHTPLLVVEQGTTEYHREYKSTISTFDEDLDSSQFGSPCTMIVGDVARLAQDHQWKEPPEGNGEYFAPLLEQEKRCA